MSPDLELWTMWYLWRLTQTVGEQLEALARCDVPEIRNNQENEYHQTKIER
jgi:hypothetical protein